MGMISKIITTVAGTLASYFATKYVTGLLEKKPLDTRINEAKTKVSQMKQQAESKVKGKYEALSKKATDLIKEKE